MIDVPYLLGLERNNQFTEPPMVMSRPTAFVAAALTLLRISSRLIVSPSCMATETAAIHTIISIPIEIAVQPTIFLILMSIYLPCYEMGSEITKIDELVKSRISDGFVKTPRSRLAGRESEPKRANCQSIKILTANLHVPS